jgi:hypothetical protein
MGVRHGENEWKRVLNTALRKRRAEIEAPFVLAVAHPHGDAVGERRPIGLAQQRHHVEATG